MPTFLTTSRMDPALAERIEASVQGRRRMPTRSGIGPRLVAIARLGAVAAVALVAWSLTVTLRRDRRELERARTELLDTVRAHGSSLTAADRECVARTESWLVRFSGAYEGDLVDDELRARGALAARLTSQAVYVRGSIGALSSPAGIAEAASASLKDAFLLCLIEPPASRTEKVLLGKVRAAYAGGAGVEEPTANVRRLHDAEVGLPLLLPPWAERVRAAEELGDLTRLRRELERAPLGRAKQAAKAGLLIVAVDEPNEGGGPTELDGEHVHQVRVGLVDVASARVLLRLRRRVDPSWISAARRPEYASGLDGCGLALDVHEGV